MTAFVRFDRPRGALSTEELTGTIELYNVDESPAVSLGGHSVPLEFDPSTALAYRLEGAPVWDFEIAGFRRGDFSLFGIQSEGDLIFSNPYYPGKIPVVFVHGTASSPARWAEMVNEFLGDSRIAGRYQFWFFIYNSGNPIPLSAMHLRENLALAFTDMVGGGMTQAYYWFRPNLAHSRPAELLAQVRATLKRHDVDPASATTGGLDPALLAKVVGPGRLGLTHRAPEPGEAAEVLAAWTKRAGLNQREVENLLTVFASDKAGKICVAGAPKCSECGVTFCKRLRYR